MTAIALVALATSLVLVFVAMGGLALADRRARRRRTART